MPVIQMNNAGSHFVVIPASVVRLKKFKNGDSFVHTERRQGLVYVRGTGGNALKLHRNGNQGSHWIIIPIDVMKKKRWKRGDSLVLGDLKDGFVLTRGEEY